MSTNIPKSLFDHFVVIADVRDEKKRRHLLIDVLVIAITAVICGADGWTQVEAFGKAREAWFRGFLQLPNGIPSHDTFGRVFSVLSPEVFEARFREWVAAVREACGQDIVAIDGKSLRRSHCRNKGLGPLHRVSAWSAANGLVLAQQATEAKSNEITAIPKVLEMLELKGCIVTIDAMGCQKTIAEKVVERGGDYVLALKGNQSTLAQAVEELFIDADALRIAQVLANLLTNAAKYTPPPGNIRLFAARDGGQAKIRVLDDGIGLIVFDNPAKHNAMTGDMLAALGRVRLAFAADPDVRVVVVRGVGERAFISGADIAQLGSGRIDTPPRAASTAPSPTRGALAIGKPVIAMIRGYCIGGGVMIALGVLLVVLATALLRKPAA